MSKPNTVKIINGLLEVPRIPIYPFERTSEIMEFLASYGYGFHGLHDNKGYYAAITFDRELQNNKSFSNCSEHKQNSEICYEITHLLYELIHKQNPSNPFW